MDSHIVGIYYYNYWHLLDLIIPFRRKSPYHHHGLSHLALHFVPSNGRFFAEVSEIYVDIERERKENYHRHCKTEKSNCFSGCGAPTMLWIWDMEHHDDCATSFIIPLTAQEDALLMHYPGFRYFVNNYKPFSPILIANESYFFWFLCRFLTFHENEK